MIKNGVILVAHPDDEFLFAHNLLNQYNPMAIERGWDEYRWTVVCATNPGKSRMVEYQEAGRAFGIPQDRWLCLNLPDGEGPLPQPSLHDAFMLLDLITQRRHDPGPPIEVLVTHNPVGEYGHSHHKSCNEFGAHLLSTGYCEHLWNFAYNFALPDLVIHDLDKQNSEVMGIYEREHYIIRNFDLISEGFSFIS